MWLTTIILVVLGWQYVQARLPSGEIPQRREQPRAPRGQGEGPPIGGQDNRPPADRGPPSGETTLATSAGVQGQIREGRDGRTGEGAILTYLTEFQTSFGVQHDL